MDKDNTLTKSEYQVMEALWNREQASNVHQILEEYSLPKPAYTTISTFLKILLKKGFVGYKPGKGKSFCYYPKIGRMEYARFLLSDIKNKFFHDSSSELIHFCLQQEGYNRKDVEAWVKEHRDK